MPKFVVTKTKDQQKELHPYLSTPQRVQQEPQSSSLLNENNEEKSTTPLKILKRFFGWFTQDSKKSNTTEQFLTINYPIDEELDRIVLPPLDLPLNPNAPNLVTAQPRLPPSQRPCIAYSEEDYSCFPYHEFDPKHPILGEHYESAHEVTLFFKNLSPYEYEVAKAVKDNLLKKCIWTPSYLVYENRRIMYSARLLAITTHLNYESFEFYKYTYDYTTNTATIIAPVFKSSPSKSDEASSIQNTLAPIDFATKSHTLVGKPVKSDYIHSDLYEDKWLADLEKYFSDKKAAAAKEAEKKAKLLAEAKAAAEKKETPVPVTKASFITPSSKPTPAFGTTTSILPLSTDESSNKKRPLTTTEEPPLKAPSAFGQTSLFQQSQTSTFSQSSSTKNKRQLSDTEDEEPRSNISKKHTITEDEDTTEDSETNKQSKPFTFSFTKPIESSTPSSDIKADEQSKSTPSFFGFGKTPQPVVPPSKPEATSTFSFDFGKGPSTATKKPSPYQSSSTFFSKPDLKTVYGNDDEKESHLEKTELHKIPIVPFGGATTLPKPSFSFGSNTDTPAFGKFNTLNTSSKPDTPKTAETEQAEKAETSTTSSKPLEEKPATTTFSGFSFGQKPASLPDKIKEAESQNSQDDTSSTDAKPEEIKAISVPSVLVTDSESSEKEKPKPASPFGSFFTPKATTLPETDSEKAKVDTTPKATATPTFSFSTSLTKTTATDSAPISAIQSTSTPFAQTTAALVPLKPSESSTQTSTAINIDSKPTEQLPAPSPGSPMSITPLQATPEKNDSMQISPPRAPNSPLSTFKQAVNPFQASTTSTTLGTSTAFKPQTSQFPKFTTNPFANPNPQPTSTPLSVNKFPTTKFSARPRPNVQPLGSTNTSVDPFASSSFSPTSNAGFNNSMSNNSFGSSNAPNPFGSTNSFAVNNNSNASNPFGSNNSFAASNNNAPNSFGSTNSFGVNNSNNTSNSFGSNSNFGSTNSFGANNNNNAPNPFGSANSFGANSNNASSSFGSANNFGSSGFGNNANNSFGSNNSFGATNSFGANNNSNSPNPFGATNSFGSNNNSAPNSFGSTNNFGQSGFGSNNNFGSPSFQSGAGHFEENGTPNALPNHLNMNQNPGFSSRTNSINSGGFSSGPNSVTSRDGSPSSSSSHMVGRVIAQPKSRRRN